jgi:uncharacterized membrane protein
MKQLLKHISLFFIFGITYCSIEILYGGSTHWSMFLVGGLSGLLGGLVDELFPYLKIFYQCFIITGIILILEYISGYIFNIVLGEKIWDYSNLPFNLNGQISLTFALIWFFLFSPLIIWFDDFLREKLWGEERATGLLSIYKGLFRL